MELTFLHESGIGVNAYRTQEDLAYTSSMRSSVTSLAGRTER